MIGMGAGADRITYGFFLSMAALLMALVLGPVQARAADERVPFTPPSMTPSLGAFGDSGTQVRDRVFDGGAPASTGLRKAAAAVSYPDGDGHSVSIRVSDSYLPDPGADQALATFLGSLLHGSEMSRLNVVVVTGPEITNSCGAGAAACYFAGENKMVIVGESSFGGLPTNYVIAHEYGHHIANHRKNNPWRAIDLGTKRWASYEGVCPNPMRGIYFPGNEGSHYFENPGEAFAEAYAKYDSRYRSFPWDWTSSLEPDATSYENIRQDVVQPWTGNTVSRFSGQVSRGRSSAATFDTPLDGSLSIKLTAPAGTDFDLALLTRSGRVLKRSARSGSREKVRFAVCGQAKLKFRVSAYRGSGLAKVTLSKP